MTAPQDPFDVAAGLTADDYRPIPLRDVTVGADHALVTHHWLDKAISRPVSRLHRVTVDSVEDGWVTVTAREEFWAATEAYRPDGSIARLVKPGDTITVRSIGPSWSDVGPRLDAHKERERRRLAGLDRALKAIPVRIPAPLDGVALDLQGVLDLLDERDRLNATVLDLHGRLGEMTRERDHALAAVDDLEEELSVLGQLDRATATIERGFEPDDAEERIEDDRHRYLRGVS